VRSLSDETRLFGRLAVFGLTVGGGYWVLTGERAGTVLLLAFGLATAIGAIAVAAGSRRSRRAGGSREVEPGMVEPGAVEPDGIESLPEPGWAPLGIAVGLGGLALGAAVGPGLMIGGLLVAIVGGRSWLAAAMRDHDASAGRRSPRD
jgi:hypothetical protein